MPAVLLEKLLLTLKELENDMLLSLVLLRAVILVFRQKSKTGVKQLR